MGMDRICEDGERASEGQAAMCMGRILQQDLVFHMVWSQQRANTKLKN